MADSTLPAAQALDLRSLITPTEQGIASRILAKRTGGNVTLFAFDAGQGLSEHTAPYDALVQVLDGRATITVGGAAHDVVAGEMLLLPANVPHALHAPQRFKMVLTMIRA